MDHFVNNLGGESWFTYPSLYSSVVQRFPSGSHFVEVGTWKGKSACYMAVEIINSNKNIRFDCVDNWEYRESQTDIPLSSFDNLYEIFLKNIEPVKNIINPVRELSWDAARFYDDKSLDFIFIDAAHDYESVKKDLEAWLPKIKDSGIIAGHDIHHHPIKQAVNEIFHNRHVHEQEDCWVIDMSENKKQ